VDDSAPKPADEDAPAASDKSQLLEAFDGVVNREREKAVQSRSLPMARRTHTAVLVLCIVAWGTLAYVWLAKPDWLFPPDPASQLSPAERESRLRFGMFLERERVLDFRATHGRLPANLAEAGDVEEGIDYTATGESTFVVSATVRDSVLTLNESERADELLKQAGVAPSRPR
jgi:hypothetical protein